MLSGIYFRELQLGSREVAMVSNLLLRIVEASTTMMTFQSAAFVAPLAPALLLDSLDLLLLLFPRHLLLFPQLLEQHC